MNPDNVEITADSIQQHTKINHFDNGLIKLEREIKLSFCDYTHSNPDPKNPYPDHIHQHFKPNHLYPETNHQ